MTAKKFDADKVDLSLIPLPAQIEEAKAFMLGAQKYGRYNYTSGLEASRLVAAALRHISQWQEGEDKDPEGLNASHLGHARACLAMILHCEALGTLKDNRRGKGNENLPVTEREVVKEVSYEIWFECRGSTFHCADFPDLYSEEEADEILLKHNVSGVAFPYKKVEVTS